MGLLENTLVALVGFGPMAAVLYFGLRGHAERFDYAKSTMMLFIGIIAGVFLAVAHMIAEYGVTVAVGLLLIEVVLALITSLFILFVFNRPRFAASHQAPFFGAVLGGGLGSMVPLGLGYRIIRTPSAAAGFLTPEILSQLLAFAFIQVAMMASAGALVAYGVYRREVLQFTAYGASVQIAAYAIMIPGILQPGDLGLTFLTLGIALAFTLVCWMGVVGGLLPKCFPLPEKKAKKIAARSPGPASGDNAKSETGGRPAGMGILADGTSAWRTGK